MTDDPIDDIHADIRAALREWSDEHFDDWPADEVEEELIDTLLGIVTNHFGL